MTILRLSLEPVVPARVPRHARRDTAGAGYRLLLDGEVPLDQDDPLLAACGAHVVSLHVGEEHVDRLQDDGFAPGSKLTVALAPDDGDRNRVVVRDAESIAAGGEVPKAHAPRIAAALEHGLELDAVAVWERRSFQTGDRVALRVLIAPVATTAIDVPADRAPGTDAIPRRPRVVLTVEGDGHIRWWDPRGGHGPLELGALPLSPDLVAELRDVERRLLDAEPEDEDDFYDFWERRQLLAEARALWRRARRQLSGRWVVGYQPPDADRPIYAERRPEGTPEFDDIPF